MIRTAFDRCAATLAMVVVGLWLAIPTPAAGKSMYELRIGGAISIQGEISPTLFAGRPCVEVVPRIRGDGGEPTHSGAGFTEIEAGRRYWMMVFFNGDERPADAPPPLLLLRDLDTGHSVRIVAGAMFGGRTGANTNLQVRFPGPGSWAVSIVDGSRSFELSSGRVFASGAGPAAQPTTPAELEETLGPTPDLDPADCAVAPASGAASAPTSSLGLPVAIGAAVVLIAGVGLLLRRRRHADVQARMADSVP